MNIRQISGVDSRYAEINREERNYAALFYHALLTENNLEHFLKTCGVSESLGTDFGIYLEYSMLRDIWFKINSENVKKEIIEKKLNIGNVKEVLSRPIVEINRYFGVMGIPSENEIQYPGHWAITKYNKTVQDNDDFYNICKFKWSFNIKPDIVIHLNKDRAICIEAKYESGEGSYPSQEKDKSIFDERKLLRVGQMELQKYMMEDLLGIKTDFVFLVFKKTASKTHKVLTWAEAFQGMELSNLPQFARDMLKNVSV